MKTIRVSVWVVWAVWVLPPLVFLGESVARLFLRRDVAAKQVFLRP